MIIGGEFSFEFLVLSVELGLRLYSISTGGQHESQTVTQARSDGVIKLVRTEGRNAVRFNIDYWD